MIDEFPRGHFHWKAKGGAFASLVNIFILIKYFYKVQSNRIIGEAGKNE